jgi:hypothetical protein
MAFLSTGHKTKVSIRIRLSLNPDPKQRFEGFNDEELPDSEQRKMYSFEEQTMKSMVTRFFRIHYLQKTMKQLHKQSTLRNS